MRGEIITRFEYYYSRKIIHKKAEVILNNIGNNVWKENFFLTVAFQLAYFLRFLYLFIESWIPNFIFDGVASKLGANKPSYPVKLLMLLCTVLDAVLILPRLFIKLSLLLVFRLLGIIPACIHTIGSLLLPNSLLDKLTAVLYLILSPFLLLKGAVILVRDSFREVSNHILCFGFGLYEVTVAQLFRVIYADSVAAHIFDIYISVALENNASDESSEQTASANKRFLSEGDDGHWYRSTSSGDLKHEIDPNFE